MLLQIYELIKQMQEEIGNGCKVWLDVQEDGLVINAEWPIPQGYQSLHAKMRFRYDEDLVDQTPDTRLEAFIGYSKTVYSRHLREA
jgi:hypothetical protein